MVSTATFAVNTTAKAQGPQFNSSVYTGYEVTGPYNALRVKGTWIVPTANCAATPNSVSNISVIIDGINGEGDAMEIGTYQDCTNGLASYGAFVNLYPETGFYGSNSLDKLAIQPGDVIEAQGTWRPSNEKPVNWNTNMVDESTCTQVDTDAYTPAGFVPKLDSGAIILSSDEHTLTALSTIQSGQEYTANATCGHRIQNSTGSDITGPQRTAISFGRMGSTSGYTLIALDDLGMAISPLSDGGTSFEISSTTSTGSTSTSTTQSPESSTTSTDQTQSNTTLTQPISSVSSSTTSSVSLTLPPPSTTTSRSLAPGKSGSNPIELISVSLVVASVIVAASLVYVVGFRKRQ